MASHRQLIDHVIDDIAAKYRDVAERVDAGGDLLPGTVVVLDPDRPNAVLPSTSAYDQSVRMRVDATAAPVQIGDLPVTGTRPGTAMRSTPVEIGGHKFHRPGTIIAKALEPLRSGEGAILVLLSRQ